MKTEERENRPVPPSVIAQYTLVVLAILTAAAFIFQIREALLAAFGGVILAITLTGLSGLLMRFLPISRMWAMISTGVLLAGLVTLFVLIFGPQISEEFEQLVEQVPQQLVELQQSLRELPMGEQLIGNTPLDFDGMQDSGNDAAENAEQDQNGEQEEADQERGEQMRGLLFQAGAMVVNVLSTMVVVLFIGIFFAVDPPLYKKAILLMVPQRKEKRVEEALDTVGRALYKWLIARLLSMTFIGVMITVSLWLIGLPLSLILGLIAGLLDFVPYVGPIAAFFPALLVAVAEGPDMILLTSLVYLAAQQLDGHVVTPIIQHYQVSIPPALVIFSIVAGGLAFGVPGVILATPLSVVVMVLVGMLYVQDVLGRDITVPGQEHPVEELEEDS